MSAQTVLEAAPSDIPALVTATANGKPLVVHYTSDDGSCSYCVDNNAFIADAAARLSNNFDFVSVTLNPWRQFFESADGKALVDFQQAQGFALSGVPSVMIFANDQPIRMLPGGNPTLISTLEEVFEAISDQELVVRGDVSVANIPASQIETYVNAFSTDRPMLLTLSSTDKNCMHCKTGNDAIDDVSRYLADDFFFARTDFDPWQRVDDDIETKAYFAGHGENLVGLPTSFLFYRGKLLSRVITNGPDLRILLPQTLPLIAGLD